ncbi:hypothetical protein MNBD_NITROSPINAE01-1819 [hydrothermal vent metagenome]|uniref:Uncharacterized protein n=1 Tax=hydrothermal vent metagenome TaxID=652676 RepID=A0A3B1CAU2_9ZZZZ
MYLIISADSRAGVGLECLFAKEEDEGAWEKELLGWQLGHWIRLRSIVDEKELGIYFIWRWL